MAVFSTDPGRDRSAGPSLADRVLPLFERIAQARIEAALEPRLRGLSDLDLARRGLTRTQVVRLTGRAYL